MLACQCVRMFSFRGSVVVCVQCLLPRVTQYRHFFLGCPGTPEPRRELAEADSLLDIGTERIWSTHHDVFRRKARRFFRNDVTPNRASWEEAGIVERQIFRRAGELGLLGITTPMELGGHGGDILTAAILWEEQLVSREALALHHSPHRGFIYLKPISASIDLAPAWRVVCTWWISGCTAPNLCLHSDLVMPYLVKYGTFQQHRKYLRRMTTGSCIGTLAFTEEEHNNSHREINTHARHDGSGWILTGNKVLVSHGVLADVIIVAAVTDENAETPENSISLFVFDKDTDGVKVGRKFNKLGNKSEDTAELVFDDVQLYEHHLLGDINKGWYHMMELLPQERLLVAGHAMGHVMMFYEETRKFIREQSAGSKRIADSQVVQYKMAEMKTAICVGRAFYTQCLLLHNRGQLSAQTAAMAKYWMTSLAEEIAAACLSLYGSYGALVDCPVARGLMDTRIQSLWAETNQTMRDVIAEKLLEQ